MKKVIAILLVLGLLLALGACSKSDGSASPGNVAPAGTQAPAAASSDTSTIAVGAVVLARDDVNEEEIYAFVSSIFENTASITQQHAKGGELDLKFASGVTSVPYHPGAARYFKEKGIDVAAVKEGAGTGAKANLTFGTGSDTGTYYGFGSVLANYVSNANDFTVTAVVSTKFSTPVKWGSSGWCIIAMTCLPFFRAVLAWVVIQSNVASDHVPFVPLSIPITTSPSMGSQA